MEENVNVRVEKKKMGIVPILFIIIVILLVILGILLYDKVNKNNEVNNQNAQNIQVNNEINNEEKVSNDSVEKNKENVTEITNDNKEQNEILQTNQMNNDAVSKAYKKLEDASWVSKGSNDKIYLFTINNGEIFYSNGPTKNLKIPFEYGKVKYLKHILNGGILYNIAVITEKGEAYYISNNRDIYSDLTEINENFDMSNLKTTKVNIDEKIIDMTTGNSITVYNSGPYYLTESGKLLTDDGKTYDEINRNHVSQIGTVAGFVYINSDKTLETSRTDDSYEWMYIVDRNSKKVKAKYVFGEMSERWTGFTNNHYYVVDENNKLLHFSRESFMIADEYPDAKGKIVSKLECDENDRANLKVKIIFTDGSDITIENIISGGYKEVK